MAPEVTFCAIVTSRVYFRLLLTLRRNNCLSVCREARTIIDFTFVWRGSSLSARREEIGEISF